MNRSKSLLHNRRDTGSLDTHIRAFTIWCKCFDRLYNIFNFFRIDRVVRAEFKGHVQFIFRTRNCYNIACSGQFGSHNSSKSNTAYTVDNHCFASFNSRGICRRAYTCCNTAAHETDNVRRSVASYFYN